MAFVQFSKVSLAFGDRDILKNVSEQNQAFELDFDLKKVKRKATAQNSSLEKPPVRKRNLKTRNSQDDSKSFDKQNNQPDMPKIYMSAVQLPLNLSRLFAMQAWITTKKKSVF